MKQIIYASSLAVVLIGLSAGGFLGQPGRAFADDPPKKAAPKAAAKPAPAAVLMPVNMEARLKAQVGQLYKTELHFMRMVTQPTRQQFEKISAQGEAVLPEIIKLGLQPARSIDEHSNPHVAITYALAKSVKEILSPEQAARYQKELDSRAAARKRVTVLSLVVKVDKVLKLSPEQRDKVENILEKDWKDTLNQAQMLMYGDDYFPTMPDIDPILTGAQKRVWGGIQKGTIGFGFNLGIDMNVDIEEESWEDERVGAKPAPATHEDNGATRRVEKK